MFILLAVLFIWDPLPSNISPPLVGYKLFYGSKSGVYDSYHLTGNVTSYDIPESDLPLGITYFTCRGVDGQNQVSQASNEVTYEKKPKPSPTPSPSPTPTPSPSPTATPTPTPTATPTPAVKRVLTVYSGSGDGSYAPGTKVTVTADSAPALFEFSEWIGDINLLTDPKKSPTTLTIPDTNCSILATYKRKL
jgi:hypothetical protein